MKPVLLAEDEPSDVFIMERAWKKAGIENELRIVKDGQQAVEYIGGTGAFTDREKHPLPCLILLDIKLPYLSGHQVIEWVRATHSAQTLPVVFLTSSANDMDIDKAYRLGGNAYLVKPPTAEKLVQMLEDLKNFWMKHNCFPPDALAIKHPAQVG
ncbi:MAG: two-component system response regulator [Verrucomicrobia bacterium]|nr:MAG: two-component system response regulator [Verrucomicrobiota bacterium]